MHEEREVRRRGDHLRYFGAYYSPSLSIAHHARSLQSCWLRRNEDPIVALDDGPTHTCGSTHSIPQRMYNPMMTAFSIVIKCVITQHTSTHSTRHS